MTDGPAPSTARLLVVGSPPLEDAAAAFELEFASPPQSESESEPESAPTPKATTTVDVGIEGDNLEDISDEHDRLDCVVTDDLEVAQSVADDCPVVFVLGGEPTDGSPTPAIDQLPDSVTEILTVPELEMPSVVRYRVQRALERRVRVRADGSAGQPIDPGDQKQAPRLTQRQELVPPTAPVGLTPSATGSGDGSGSDTAGRDGTVDARTHTHEHLERSERLQALVENVPVILFVLDQDGVFTLSQGRGLEALGLEANELVGQSVFDRYHEDVHRDVRRALAGESVHSQQPIGDRIFENWYRPILVDGTVDRVIGVSVDVTQRVHYEQTLSALHETTQSLLSIDSITAACEKLVDVATEVLELTSVAVYRFDPCENELVPVAHSPGMIEYIGSLPRFQPAESITWRVFAEGEAELFDDVRTSPDNYDGPLKVRSGLFVPMGDHGILLAISSEIGLYDQQTFELVELLGATGEAALDRIDRTTRLHERERDLKQQNEHLERLNRAGQMRNDVEQLLLRANSREEIERGVCTRLAELEDCSFAWIGEPDPSGTHLSPRTTAGSGRGYLEAVTVTTVDEDAAEPTGRAAKSRRVRTVGNVAEAFHDGTWRAEALSRRFQSVLAVPLIYDTFLYGVLSVYADRPYGFDEAMQSTLADLADQIAYAIDATTRKNALESTEITEIELEIPHDGPLSAAAATLESQIELEGTIAQADGSTIVFLWIDADADPDAIASVDGLEAVTVIDDRDGQLLVQARLVDAFLGTAVSTHGGTLRSLRADPEGLYAGIDIPTLLDVRAVLTALAREGWNGTLRARRERSTPKRPAPASSHPTDSLLETVTDRQREVVQTAYHGGFFEWPRTMTGEEVADSLDISSPAFHNHVRTVERKLFGTLFDTETRSDEG